MDLQILYNNPSKGNKKTKSKSHKGGAMAKKKKAKKSISKKVRKSSSKKAKRHSKKKKVSAYVKKSDYKSGSPKNRMLSKSTSSGKDLIYSHAGSLLIITATISF